jgi:capreomycidine synthase
VDVAAAMLQAWYREFPPENMIDLSSSGVRPYTLAEVRRLGGLTDDELDGVAFHDSGTLGGARVRSALAARFDVDDPSRVMATAGSSEAIFLLLGTLLSADDDVVLLTPAYHALASVPALAGANVRAVSVIGADGYHAEVDAVIDAIRPQTRAVVVNFPHNPTGVTISEPSLRRLVEAVEATDAYLVWDAAFAELALAGPELPDPAQWSDRVLTLGTLSKAYGFPGLRVGWCIAPAAVLERTIGLHDATTLALSPLVELVASRILEAGDAFVAPRREAAARNLERVADWVSEIGDLVTWTRPAGGVSAFLRLEGVDDDELFCRRLAAEAGVLLVPGVAFEEPGHVRLGFGGDETAVETGLDRLGAFLRRPGSRLQAVQQGRATA